LGSLTSKISDDIDEYKRLCEIHNEDIQYINGHFSEGQFFSGSPDCYGKHAERLRKTNRN